jgi:energy-coupling factor transporter ATP-binding protein EcfA2
VTVDIGNDDAALREHRIVSSVVGTLLAMRGDLVLHASAVAVGGRAVVFCGPTGRGKSTLALALGQAGHPVLGEDGVAIDLERGEPVAFPGARGIRVRSRGADGSRRTNLVEDPAPGEPPPCPVAAVVLLDERGEELSIEPLPAARGVALLTPNLTHSGGRESIAAAFGRLARLLGTVPAFRASLPEDLGSLPAAAAGLLDGVASRG